MWLRAIPIATAFAFGCGEDPAPPQTAVEPPQTGAEPAPAAEPCEVRDVRGRVRVDQIDYSIHSSRVWVEFTADEAMPSADERPEIDRLEAIDFPCGVCLPQLGVRVGTTVPVTAQVTAGQAGCDPFHVEPWSTTACRCDAPMPPLRIARVTLSERQPTLPATADGTYPGIQPQWGMVLTPPVPFRGTSHTFETVAVGSTPWRCDFTLSGAGGHPTAARARCTGGGEPLDAAGTCDSAWQVDLGFLAGQAPVRYEIQIACEPVPSA